MSAPARVPGPAALRPGSHHPVEPAERPADGSRAVLPDASGIVERDGVRTWWERYGDRHRGPGVPVIALMPTWSIVHSRTWKAQVAYLARHAPVVLFDGRGNGRSDRPRTAEAYAADQYAQDALAVFDATGTETAVLVSLSLGAQWSLLLAATCPELVAGAVFLGPALGLALRKSKQESSPHPFDLELETYEGWGKYNRHYWRRDYRDFLTFFFGECLPEPHSTKPTEDCVGWGLDTDVETLLLTEDAPVVGRRETVEALARSVRCPVLVLHGSDDRIIPHAGGAALAELTGGRLVTFEGSGHLVQARQPVRTNLLIRSFYDAVAAGSVR